MQTAFRRCITLAQQTSPWDLSNKVLYDLCRTSPLHVDAGVVLAKMLLIGRTYAAAIERRRTKDTGNDHFYTTEVAPTMIKSKIDAWIQRASKTSLASDEGLRIMIETHARTTELFRRISGLEKRSLASKYLHFHVPELFFILDARAVQGMRKVRQIVGRVSASHGRGDPQYTTFAEKCNRLRAHCENEFDIRLSPRRLDSLLLALYENKSSI